MAFNIAIDPSASTVAMSNGRKLGLQIVRGAFFAFVVCVASVTSLAGQKNALKESNVKPVAVESDDGPDVHIPGQGCIAIVDAYGTTSTALSDAAKKMSDILNVEFTVKKGAWSLETWRDDIRAVGAEIVVFVIDKPALPMSLVSMESKWAVVNASGLAEDQLRKEIVRVTTILLGAANSKYPASALHPVFSPADLDKVGDIITFDALQKIYPQLGMYGLTPSQDMSYRDACREGKAPPPQTPIEKKIAEEVAKEKK